MKRRKEPCPECGSFSIASHGPLCSKQTDLQWKKQAKRFYELFNSYWNRNHRLVQKYKTDITFWQGKFRIVVAENNALRKKLNYAAPPQR